MSKIKKLSTVEPQIPTSEISSAVGNSNGLIRKTFYDSPRPDTTDEEASMIRAARKKRLREFFKKLGPVKPQRRVFVVPQCNVRLDQQISTSEISSAVGNSNDLTHETVDHSPLPDATDEEARMIRAARKKRLREISEQIMERHYETFRKLAQ